MCMSRPLLQGAHAVQISVFTELALNLQVENLSRDKQKDPS